LGCHQGKGSLKLPDESIYEGDFFNNKFSGFGKFAWINGEEYEGEWSEDKKHGKGRYTYEDGQIFYGDFVEDNPHGFGELKKVDGTVYQGFWDNGTPKGVGLGLNGEMKTVGRWNNGSFSGWDLEDKGLVKQMDNCELSPTGKRNGTLEQFDMSTGQEIRLADTNRNN